MKFTFENNIKKINGDTLETLLERVSPDDEVYNVLMELFHKINSFDELILELKELYKTKKPVFIFIVIKCLGGYSMRDANEILEEVIKDGKPKI